MANLTIRNASGVNKYLGAVGAGTDLSPFITLHQAVNSDGEVYMNDPLLTAAAQELVAINRITHVNKFGSAADVDTNALYTVWDGKTTGGDYPDINYTWPSDTGAVYYLSSSAAGDTQDYEVQGLDGDFAVQAITVTATGLTPVAIQTGGGSETWVRVFRIKNLGTTNNAGIIFVNRENNHTVGIPDDSSQIAAMIQIGKNQTLMALSTVPAGKTAYLKDRYYSCGKAEDFLVEFHARSFGSVFRVQDRQFLYQQFISNDTRPYTKYLEKTDFEILAQSLSNVNKPVSAGYNYYLVDNV